MNEGSERESNLQPLNHGATDLATQLKVWTTSQGASSSHHDQCLSHPLLISGRHRP